MSGLAETLAALKALESDTPHPVSPSKPSKQAFEPFESEPDRRVSRVAPLSATDFAERAAVIKEGAKAPRVFAEEFARFEASDGGNPDAAGRAPDAWAVQANALGWQPAELLALAAQGEVVALTAEGLTLRIGDAVRHIRRGAA